MRWVIRYPLHTQDSGFKSRCALSLLKLRSRYETDCMIFIPCEGDFSLVLLGMFSHPYPTLVPSYPHPYSHLEKPIVLVWETWDVLLFRQRGCLKMTKSKKIWESRAGTYIKKILGLQHHVMKRRKKISGTHIKKSRGSRCVRNVHKGFPANQPKTRQNAPGTYIKNPLAKSQNRGTQKKSEERT